MIETIQPLASILPMGALTDDTPSLIEIEVEGEGTIDGMEIPEQDVPPDITELTHETNLANHIAPSVLSAIGQQILDYVKIDRASRADWEKGFKEGLKQLAVGTDQEPGIFSGACTAKTLIIPEAAVRFQANAIMEIFPPSGPVKTNIIGRVTKEKEEQSERVRDRMNYSLTEVIPDYRRETEKLLFGLATIGCAFRKVFANPTLNREDAKYIPAEDILLPYGCSSLANAPRVTEVLRLFPGDVKALQAAGVYRSDVEIDETQSSDDIKDAKDQVNQVEDAAPDGSIIELYESHINLNIDTPGLYAEDGVEKPYIVTVDKSGNVLGLYRNWEEGANPPVKIPYYAQYDYIPGFGAYGWGLLHLIGNSSKTATAILRQLVDAGSFATLPGGFKAKGVKTGKSDFVVPPGTWVETELFGNKLADSFFPLPYREPSGVLLTLLDKVEEAGRRLGSIADAEVGDVNSQAPVGTTYAVMERAMKVMSAIQARLHASMRDEFRILARVIRDFTDDTYEYDVIGATREIKRSDFDNRIDIVPVSDPNAATVSQRMMLYQMAVQLSQTAPQVFDLPKLYRQMLTVSGIQGADELVPDRDDIPPMEPDIENMAMVTGKPTKVYEYQPHEQHIIAHNSFIQDPATAAALGQNPQANAIFAAFQAHIAEHYAFQYRNQIQEELGFPLPGMGETMPPEIQTQIAFLVAKAGKQLLAKNQAKAAQQQAEQQAADPVFQMQQAELQLKKLDIEQKQQAAQARLAAEVNATQTRASVERERIAAQERMAQDAAIDRGEKFLAEAKLNAPTNAAKLQKIKAEIAQILSDIEQASQGAPNA